MSNKVIEVFKAFDTEELQDVLNDIRALSHSETGFFNNCDGIQLTLLERTLSDGSVVYDINAEIIQ